MHRVIDLILPKVQFSVILLNTHAIKGMRDEKELCTRRKVIIIRSSSFHLNGEWYISQLLLKSLRGNPLIYRSFWFNVWNTDLLNQKIIVNT